MTGELTSLFVVMTLAATVPLVGRLLPVAVPQVVLLLFGGVLIGPQVLAWAHRPDLELLANVGLGFLFLLAGYELPPLLLRQRAGRLALIGWGCSVVLAFVVVGVLELTGLVSAFVPVALALTTTALGTLLPILRDNNMLQGAFGQHMFAAGAVGELGPVLTLSLFLGANGSWVSALAIAAVAGVAWGLAKLAPTLAKTRIGTLASETAEDTTQTVLRWTIALLLAGLLITADFGLDIVLGAFIAGMVLRRSFESSGGLNERLLSKLDAIGYGFFIPIFFIYSGMGLDLESIADNPGRLLLFFTLLLVVRGAPGLLVYRHDLPTSERVQLAFLSATALPLIVALAEIGLQNGTMRPENAAALVGAGALSVAVFPLVALTVRRRTSPAHEIRSPDAVN